MRAQYSVGMVYAGMEGMAVLRRVRPRVPHAGSAGRGAGDVGGPVRRQEEERRRGVGGAAGAAAAAAGPRRARVAGLAVPGRGLHARQPARRACWSHPTYSWHCNWLQPTARSQHAGDVRHQLLIDWAVRTQMCVDDKDVAAAVLCETADPVQASCICCCWKTRLSADATNCMYLGKIMV